MKTPVFLLALLCLAGSAGAAVLPQVSVGKGHGVDLPGSRTDCISNIQMNYDGSAENGCAWQYEGIAPPYYGAFAECFYVTSQICGVEFKFTGLGSPCRPCDIYIWSDAGGKPGNVLLTWSGFDPCPVATWPNISTHDACCSVEVNGMAWVGYWADFSHQEPSYFIAADTDGPGGCPMTNIAPGIGFPTGWNNVSVVWGPIQALGIGISSDGCGIVWGGCYEQPSSAPAVPAARGELSTWGRIKALNR